MADQIKTNTKVVTGRIRMSSANLFTPRAMVEGQDPKYSLCVLIPKSDKETVNKINSAIDVAKKAGASLWGGKIPANLKTPLRDGDEEVKVIDLKNEEELPKEVKEALRNPTIIKTAYNSNFERTCIAAYFKINMPPE